MMNNIFFFFIMMIQQILFVKRKLRAHCLVARNLVMPRAAIPLNLLFQPKLGEHPIVTLFTSVCA